jgi:hypothetical protein
MLPCHDISQQQQQQQQQQNGSVIFIHLSHMPQGNHILYYSTRLKSASLVSHPSFI